jgi:hypothetical protein
VGDGPLVFLTEMKLKYGRRLYNQTKPEKARVLSPGFSQHELCGTNLYMSVCIFALIKDVCQKCDLCYIVQFLQNAAEELDRFETVFFSLFLTNLSTLIEFCINN